MTPTIDYDNVTKNFTDHNYDDQYAYTVIYIFGIYYTPILVLLGSVGNLASVFVFYNSKLRLQSISQYLSALAISDTIFLWQLLGPWLNTSKLSGVFNWQGFCQGFVYISYVTCCTSAWLVVAFTLERFVAVLYPLRRNAMCTVKRARHIIAGIVVGATLLNLPMLRYVSAKSGECTIDSAYMELAAEFNILDTAVAFTVPLSAIVVLNAWIMIGVCRLERARHLLLKQDPPPRRPLRISHCPRSQHRVTRMLLVVSSVFVVLNLPAYSIRIIAYSKGYQEIISQWNAIQQVGYMLFEMNFGINFILYCLSGQNFRRALRQTLPWIRQRAMRADAVRRAAAVTTSFRPTRASSVSTSYTSNCTEATSNCAVSNVTPNSHRRRRDNFISRWTFDNTRHHSAHHNVESIEINRIQHRHIERHCSTNVASVKRTQ